MIKIVRIVNQIHYNYLRCDVDMVGRQCSLRARGCRVQIPILIAQTPLYRNDRYICIWVAAVCASRQSSFLSFLFRTGKRIAKKKNRKKGWCNTLWSKCGHQKNMFVLTPKAEQLIIWLVKNPFAHVHFSLKKTKMVKEMFFNLF